jgi:hypothetical protein
MSYNLVQEKWIETNHGYMSLIDVFNEGVLLTSTPLTKISIIKLLSAITTRVMGLSNLTSEDVFEDIDDLRERIEQYLNMHIDRFNLYDDSHPFLQVPNLKKLGDAELNHISIDLLDVASTDGKNTSILNKHQQPKSMDDRTIINLLITYLNFYKNKKGSVDNTLTCMESIEKKEATYSHIAKGNEFLFQGKGTHRSLPSPMTKSSGTDKSSYDFSIKGDSLHVLVNFKDVLHTTVLLSERADDIELGVPVWELNDISESSPELMNTHIASLLPMYRFVLINGNTFIATNGAMSKLYSPTQVMDSENNPVSLNVNIPWNNLRNIPNIIYNKTIKRSIELINYALNDVMYDDDYANIELITPSIEVSSGEIYAINNDGNSISYDVNKLIKGNVVNETITKNLVTLSDLLVSVNKFENTFKKLTENKSAFDLYLKVSTMLNNKYIELSNNELIVNSEPTQYAGKLLKEIINLVRDIISPKSSNDVFNFYKNIKMIGYKNEKRK